MEAAHAVRTRFVGSDLAVDLHGSFNLPDALRICKDVEHLDLLWLEDPVRWEWGNVDAMANANVIRVKVRLPKTHPLAVKYGVNGYPTTLLIAPDGALVTSRRGYIGEVAFRARFLKGMPRE